MASTLSTLSTVLFILAALFFVLAIVFFFAFKIPSVIGYLSGKDVRKSILETRLNNEKSGIKSYDIGKINYERGKITAKIKKDENLDENDSEEIKNSGSVHSPNLLAGLDVSEGGSTALLEDSDETESNQTELLNDSKTKIQKQSTETELLSDQYRHQSAVPSVKKNIELIEEVIILHTNEVI